MSLILTFEALSFIFYIFFVAIYILMLLSLTKDVFF